ncbi:BlaI/MecI/CopY family transcriptional regulator [Streptomyces sp. NPDC048297]|uniref:BlaI/MecI/CopY family transcriptional regulator n=1 Tax=Streptomyces sp. NPDC048297 TaxID=3365531 RepID=UPI0037207421
MSEGTTTATELASHYISQVAGDLDHNVKEQERITAELAALQEQLATLQRDHAVLVSMQQALGVGTLDTEPASVTGSAVPAPRKKATTGTDTSRQEKKATTGQPKADRQPAKKSADKKGTTKEVTKGTAKGAMKGSTKAAMKDATKGTQPTLIHLIHLHLTEQNEPRSAAEVSEALSHAHPDRTIATTVVRTSLETLVAKSLAQRTRQGRSVFYTATHTPDPAPAQTPAPTDTDDAQPETAA